MKYALPLFALLAAPANAEDVTQIPIEVPSGQAVYWQDMSTGTPGAHGLTYRFRFVAPDLANLVPMALPAPMELVTEEDMAALEELAASEGGAALILNDALGEGLILPSELDQAAETGPEISIDLTAGIPTDPVPGDEGLVLPPAPESLLRDPMHDDIVWLCENYVLPRIAHPGPRPTKIVISLSDRPQQDAELVPGAVQLFEAFSLPPDRDICIWEPF